MSFGIICKERVIFLYVYGRNKKITKEKFVPVWNQSLFFSIKHFDPSKSSKCTFLYDNLITGGFSAHSIHDFFIYIYLYDV